MARKKRAAVRPTLDREAGPLRPVRQRPRPPTPPEPAETPPPMPPADGARDETPYEVGYGRPPKHTRFKPGQSGFPSGRPKGSKNVSTYIDEALGTRVGGNGSRRIPLAKVIASRIVADAAKGSVRHQQMLVDREKARAARAEAADRLQGPPLSPEEREAADRMIVEEFIRMVREGMAELPKDQPSQEARP
jgi:hypothetical protein